MGSLPNLNSQSEVGGPSINFDDLNNKLKQFPLAKGLGGNTISTVSPDMASIQQPVSEGQLNQAGSGVATSLASQQNLLNALGAQNGLGQQQAASFQQQSLAQQLGNNQAATNQGNVYGQSQSLLNALAQNGGLQNQSGAMRGQQMLNSQLGNAGGVSAQQQALMQQQMINQQLGGGIQAQNSAIHNLQNLGQQQAATGNIYSNIAAGQGPNPAQAQLNQATGQNVANQAALMAGQRGAGANVGLMARQIGQQGAATQQQAVGQGATMQAQQQLNALSGLTAQQQAQAQTQSALGGLGSTQAGMQQSGVGQLAGMGQNITGQQQAGLNNQAALANQQIAQQQAQQQALAGQAQNQVGNQLAANQAAAGQANTMAGQQINQTNTFNAAQQAQQNAMLGAVSGANQAQVSSQGSVNQSNAALNAAKYGGASSAVGGLLSGAGALGAAYLMSAEGGEVKDPQKMAEGGAPIAVGIAPQATTMQAQAPIVPQMQQPTGPQSGFGQFLKNRDSSFAQGGSVDLRSGGDVKARKESEKAVKSGNSYDNDKIPAMLSEKEIVLPREVTQSKDPVRSAADFVAKVIAKRGRK